MSRQMAAACDEVVAMIEAVPAGDPPEAISAALDALIPLLEKRANSTGAAPPVRSVYAGAATRIREVLEAERRHAAGETTGADDDA